MRGGSRPPPPVRPFVAAPPEELNSDFLADDSGSHEAAPAVPISSSSLLDDPSAPDLEPHDPVARVGERARGPEAAGFGGAFAAVASPDHALAADAPDELPAAPLDVVQVDEPSIALGPPSDLSDPYARQTEITARPLPAARIQARPRATWVVPAVILGGAMALSLTVGVVALAVRLVHSTAAPAAEPGSAVSPEPTASSFGPAPAASTSGAPAAPLPSPAAGGTGPCVLAGAPHTVTPRALLRAGVETTSNAERIALGVALGDREGFVVSLDPSTFVASASAKARADDPIRHVVPVLGAAADVRPFFETAPRHPKSTTLQAAFPVAADPPFVVGFMGGAVVWAPSSASAATPLWPAVGDGTVDAMRVIPLMNHAGFALAFRQGSSIFLGGLHEDKTPNGELVRVAGLGPQIGAPTLAAAPDHALVAWADRAGPSVPWAIRWVPWRPGTELPAPTPFPVPTGGGAAFAMSPALTSISGGRLVMAWTEGVGARHDVRTQAFDSSDHPIGTALTVSAEGVNAGQGVPALTEDGRGAIVFLASPSGPSASVVAVPIVCP